MKHALSISLFLLCALQVLGCSAHASPPRADAKEILTALLEALNSKDLATLTTFAQKHCTDSQPPAERAKRMMGLADQGAPFKLVRVGTQAPGLLGAVVSDKSGEQIGMRLMLTQAAEPKLLRVLAGPPEDADVAAPKDYTGWKDLPSLAESVRTDTKVPALALAVLRDGKLEKAVSGVRKTGTNETVNPDEPFSIGSIGKPICTTIIGKLIEEGKLDWSTTLGEALKDIPMKDEHKPITLEQLMQHRAGIPQDMGFRKPDIDRIMGGATEPMAMRTNYAKDILSRTLISKPGEKFAYSNAGYALLGVVAERIAGKPYEQLVQEMVFQPLGLKNSYTFGMQLPQERPNGHVPGPQGLQIRNMAGPLEKMFAPAGGGLYMSVADLVRFGQAHLDGLQGKDGLLKASTVQRLHKGVPEAFGPNIKYACGWGLEDRPGIELMHGHNGSNGTMMAQLGVFPKAGIVIAALTNAGGETEPSPALQAVLAVAEKYAKK